MNVDAHIPSWTQEEKQALDSWRQGHLLRVEKTPWVAETAVAAPAVSVPNSVTAQAVKVEKSEQGAIEFAAVISQTCDIIATGPGARHPFVQVAPVRDVSTWNAEKLDALKNHEVNDFVLLTEAPAPDGVWAIDLRMSWPVAKTLLVREVPVAGFSSADDERHIGAHLARKFERPAFPDVLSKDLPDALRACVKAGRKKPYLLMDVIQIRLDILSGTRVAPGDVRIVVIANSVLTPDQMEPLRNVWEGFKKPLKAAGMTWVSMTFTTLDDLSARVYRDSTALNIPELHSGNVNR